MIVKPQTFKSGGHCPTAKARFEYLQKDGRELAVSTQNINNENNWAKEMDQTTERYHLRGDVVAREFVLSPSPEDKVNTQAMLDYAREWTIKNFPDHEAAIVIHNDSTERLAKGEEGIVHAHVYVNAPNLSTGKKMQLDNTAVRRLHDSAQEMSAQRGWSQQQDYYDQESKRVQRVQSNRNDFEKRPMKERSARYKGNSPSIVKTRHELEQYEKSQYAQKGLGYREYKEGISGRELDKTYIRRSLKESAQEVAQSSNATLKESLQKRGVNISHAADGDFKYSREGQKFVFKGKTLGNAFERTALKASITLNSQLSREIENEFD